MVVIIGIKPKIIPPCEEDPLDIANVIKNGNPITIPPMINNIFLIVFHGGIGAFNHPI